jgi:tetratricopeptide (TPR) repeat protein
LKFRQILILFLFVLTVLFFLLTQSGCARNRQQVREASHPTEMSSFLYSAGTILYNEYQFDKAEVIYRLARRYDPNSPDIRRAIFNSIYFRVESNQVPLSYFEGFADSLLTEGTMDKEMLELTYNLYARHEEYAKARKILNLYLKQYESARAYSSLYFLEKQAGSKLRPELLDKAYKLADDEDTDFLNGLGMLYLDVDSTKAEAVWQKSFRINPSTQAADYLWDFYAARNDSDGLKQIFNSFTLPDDKPRMLELLTQTLAKANYNSVLAVKDLILATDDSELLMKLLQASWYADDSTVFEHCLSLLQTRDLDYLDSQLVSFFAALGDLRQNDLPSALSQVAKLDGLELLNEFLTIYRADFLHRSKEDNEQALKDYKKQLQAMLKPATDKQLAWQVKNYLKAAVDGLTVDNLVEVEDEQAYFCATYFYDEYRRTYDTYLWLARYYQKTNSLINLRALLREAINQFPEDSSLLNWLGYSYVEQGINLGEAEVLIQRALQLSPDNPYYLDSLAWLYFLKDDYVTAWQYMELPSRLDNLPSEMALHAAKILIGLERYQDSIPYLQMTIKSNDDPDAVAEALDLIERLTP